MKQIDGGVCVRIVGSNGERITQRTVASTRISNRAGAGSPVPGRGQPAQTTPAVRARGRRAPDVFNFVCV